MLWIVLPLIAALGGIIHTITGFGSGIVMMLFLPSFLDMASAPALSSSINLFLSLILAFKFRKTIRIRMFLLPIIPYLLGSTMAIYALSGFDMRMVAISFGVFLIILSLYFTFVAKKMTVTPNWQTAVLCGGISGVTAGLFGIGGPLMALYFLGLKTAFTVLVLRCFLNSLFSGGITALAFSLTGGILAMLVMALVRKFPFLSIYGVSILGAAAHNIGQICAAMILLKSFYVFAYLPLLLVVSVVTGLITAAASSGTFRALAASGQIPRPKA
jgi:uncharacterized membrane protein YfcA